MVQIADMRTVDIVSHLLQVKTGTLCSALTIKKSQAGRGMDSFVTYYRHDEVPINRLQYLGKIKFFMVC